MNRAPTAVLALVAVAVLTAGALPSAVVASHDPDNVDYVVDPGDPSPGASDVSYTHRADLFDNFAGDESGFEDVTDATFSISEADVTGCGSSLPGDLDPSYRLTVTEGTGSQEEFDEYEGSFNGGTADFEITSSGNDYAVGERLQLELNDCVTNPENPGWYQADLTVKGETFGDGERATLESTSHYFAICEDCDNRSAARDELGPPPSEQQDDSPTDTPTATPTATPPEPEPTPTEPDDTPTPTPTDPEPTPTEPDDTPTPSPTATATPSPDGAQGEFFGMDPILVVGVVAAISIGLAAFGATRL